MKKIVYHDVLLKDSIKAEKAGKEFIINKNDKNLIYQLLKELRKKTNVNYKYLSEIAYYKVEGAGEVVEKYIREFEDEEIKAALVHHLVDDHISEAAELILNLYLGFRSSNRFVSQPEVSAPLSITTNYDNAFWRLKPKKLRQQLFDIISNPRDAYYLPLTVGMLASWKVDGLDTLLLRYLSNGGITREELGLVDISKAYYPSYEDISRELIFTALSCLKYYNSISVASTIQKYANSKDEDVRKCALKSLNYMQNK